jgi:hypothetical protein
LNALVHKQCIRTYYKGHGVIFGQGRESSIDLVAVTGIKDAQRPAVRSASVSTSAIDVFFGFTRKAMTPVDGTNSCLRVHRLRDRLGGVYSIATVMDDFIDRIMIDPRLNANPKVDEAHHRGNIGKRGSASFPFLRCRT